MNWQHFQAFLWLRWRLLVNQLRRGGIANAVIQVFLAVLVLISAVGGAVTAFLVGLLALENTPFLAPYLPILFVWDGLVVALLFSWMIGLAVDLQRSEVLSLDKFLHLPVSLKSAFLINYLSSFLSVSLLLFLPAMFALSLGLLFSRGPLLALAFPLLAGFVLTLTALTYQFQGWLAALMVNQRRRRTVIVVVTAVIVVLAQLPNMANLAYQRSRLRTPVPVNSPSLAEIDELDRAYKAKEISATEYLDRMKEKQIAAEKQKEAVSQQLFQQQERTAVLMNMVLPPGWLPLGVMDLAKGEVIPALLATLAFTTLGAASLWRAYQTTLRIYTGQYTSGQQAKKAAAPAVKTGVQRTLLLEKHLPWFSEQTSAIALGSFCSLTRAPEAKMLLLSPVILVLVFGSMFMFQNTPPAEMLRPLMAFGAMAMTQFSMVQLIGNQFGFDRSGFRVYVLSAAPRRDILLGKNLSTAPLAMGLAGCLVILLQCVYPQRLDHFLASVPRLLSLYLSFCFAANWLSILAPIPIRAGSFKPANPRGMPLLLQLVFMLVLPLVLGPTLVPLALESGLEFLGWTFGIPIDLILSLLLCVAVIFLYRAGLAWQGRVLQSREKKILEVVTSKME